MKDIQVKVHGESGGDPANQDAPEVVLGAINQDIEDFSTFMASLPDWRASGPLNNGEKALLRTYLVHKYRGRF